MNAEKTIKICGQDVLLRYCLASETGFEALASGKDANVFNPTPTGKTDEDGNQIFAKPMATTDDIVRLGIACMIAAYEQKKQEPPVTVDDILYNAAPNEIASLITTTIELRLKWHQIAPVVKPETDKKEDNEKNV